jgi:NADPH:quinone reductase-like Zn-dependent oxidoreductase
MKAVQYRRYGDETALENVERERPRARGRKLLVRVWYSSVNPIDWKIRNGMVKHILPLRFPAVPGFDISGEVVEVGPRVSRFKPGDVVFARLDSISGGASAEYALVGERAAAHLTEGLDAKDAAAMPLAALTALQALRDHGRIASGKRVLIIGASGGVGHYALQIAKTYGAQVTGVCSGGNVELIRELGADHVIDYQRDESYDAGAPYDIILDLVASPDIGSFTPLMSDDSVYVATVPTLGLLTRMLTWSFTSKRRARFVTVKSRGSDLEEIAALVSRGELRTVIDSVYPLERLDQAHRRSETNRARGKVVVEVCAECASGNAGSA